MMNKLLAVAFSGVIFGLSGCGGTAKIGGGKTGAAEALFAAGDVAKTGSSSMGSGIDLTLDHQVSCPKGGNATLKLDLNSLSTVGTGTGSANTGLVYTVVYANCGAADSDAGTAVLNGTATVTLTANVSGGSGTAAADVGVKIKGKITYGGAFNDFIDADVTETVSATATIGTGASVDAKLAGTISTSSGSFTYDASEAITLQPGKITIAGKT